MVKFWPRQNDITVTHRHVFALEYRFSKFFNKCIKRRVIELAVFEPYLLKLWMTFYEKIHLIYPHQHYKKCKKKNQIYYMMVLRKIFFWSIVCEPSLRFMNWDFIVSPLSRAYIKICNRYLVLFESDSCVKKDNKCTNIDTFAYVRVDIRASHIFLVII